MENILGVVLCGGQSKRMGSDKGLLLKDGTAWAVLIAQKLEDAGLSVVVSINEQQQQAYHEIFPETPLIVDHLPIDGPLDGLLSMHRNFPEKDILLMACDLIDMKPEVIQNLVTSYNNSPEFDYCVYEQNGFTQPFCAIYTAKGLAQVYDAFEQKLLKKYSLHERFETGKTLYLPVEDEDSFRNYNQIKP
ncbi:MAG TPA: molybdenum cofactor guanylyltransferase [Pedobacter sp.]|jgi:molybdopterin-guanine dinucleotide biosynthesis protein A